MSSTGGLAGTAGTGLDAADSRAGALDSRDLKQ